MRINSQGHYEYCRWAVKINNRDQQLSIRDIEPTTWFQENMADVRVELLNGRTPGGCTNCTVMEKHNKVSGRQRQLLKIGVQPDNFVPSMISSPWKEVFTKSINDNGYTDQITQDWQIDLGNYCNSACLFCSPVSSSRLATEYKKLGIINQIPLNSWADDPELLEKFISALKDSKRLIYLHFLGGETLITPAFAKILSALIKSGLSQEVSIGFTTNLTVWDDRIIELLLQFREVNLGMSIECFHPVNEYARFGGNLEDTEKYLEKWLDVAEQFNWLTQLRTTPTILTALHLDTVYRYALSKKLVVESCNFLEKPEFMRVSVLPHEYRLQIISRLQNVLNSMTIQEHDLIINGRDRSKVNTYLQQDISSYIKYLNQADDESFRLVDLVRYLKTMETSRKNCILDYIPEYEELLRTAGY